MERLKLLPRTTQMIIDTVGIKLTLELVREFGGSSFAVPAEHLSGSVYHALKHILGNQTRPLMKVFRGQDLIIPSDLDEIESAYLERLTQSEQFYDEISKYSEILPESGKELVEVIGMRNAIEVIKKYGGNTMLITNAKDSYAYQDLRSILDESTVAKIVQHYQGTRLYIPRCFEAMVKIRNVEFWKAVEKLIIDLGISQERAIFLLGPRFGITYRQAFNIKKEMNAEREASKQQALI